MKRKNGFTLIELLAVIVILAIIALIAVPIVLNMINSARKKAAESSALGFIDAIEYNNGFAQTEQAGYTEINGENLDVTSATFNNLKLKGKKPTSGTVTIVNGKVTSATDLCFNDYKVNYDGRVATVEGKCDGSSSSSEEPSTPEPATPTYTAYSIGQSINYNPVDNAACTTPISTTGTKTGCMKWYVISASGTSDSTVDVILDHNTTAKVAWVTQADYADDTNWSYNYRRNDKGPITANAQLATDTTEWTSGLNPRLITADEIAHIVGADSDSTIKWSSSKNSGTDDIENKSSWFYLDGSGTTYSSSDGWQKQVATSQGASNYAWLFDYTYGCTYYGCNTADTSTTGYWTSSPAYDSLRFVLRMYYGGRFDSVNVDYDNYVGIRPVITISKTALQ